MAGEKSSGKLRDKSKDYDKSGEKLIATNPMAGQKYFIDELIEAGIVLTGTEAKSIRLTAPNLRDAYVEVRPSTTGLEAWLLNMHIGPYSHGNIWNHEPIRKRKLLLHAREIERMFGNIMQKGMTVIPTRMYFKSGRAKVELGLGKGKKKHDKRQTLREKSAEREMDQAMKKGSRRSS
jgi:SsrA-binding protein